MKSRSQCVICEKLRATKLNMLKTWWHLYSYYGISGQVCSNCYRKVEHDAYGNPVKPRAYLNVCKKLGIERNSNG